MFHKTSSCFFFQKGGKIIAMHSKSLSHFRQCTGFVIFFDIGKQFQDLYFLCHRCLFLCLITPGSEKFCKQNNHIAFHHLFHADVPGVILGYNLFHDLTHPVVSMGFKIQIMFLLPASGHRFRKKLRDNSLTRHPA